MEAVRKEIRNDLFLLQIPVQILLYYVFENYFINISFFLGCLISLANFNLMALQTQNLADVEDKKFQKRLCQRLRYKISIDGGDAGSSNDSPTDRAIQFVKWNSRCSVCTVR